MAQAGFGAEKEMNKQPQSYYGLDPAVVPAKDYSCCVYVRYGGVESSASILSHKIIRYGSQMRRISDGDIRICP